MYVHPQVHLLPMDGQATDVFWALQLRDAPRICITPPHPAGDNPR